MGHSEQAMHSPTGRWKLGLVLSLVTVQMWSTVPIALKVLLGPMDAITITWYRYFVAAFVLAVFLGRYGSLPSVRKLRGWTLWLVLVAALGLCGSFLLFLLGLNYISPGASQVVIQLAPTLVLLGGVLIFKESFRPIQWLGFVIIVVGLGLFFNQRYVDFAGHLTDYWSGVLLVVLAAAIWAAYALAQKQLLNVYSSSGILLMLYSIGILLMLPLASLGQLTALNVWQLIVLGYCCLNMIVGYGCFAEALEHWEASRVGAVTASAPLFTLAFTELGFLVFPGAIEAEHPNLLGVVGAVMVVSGSVLAALGKKPFG